MSRSSGSTVARRRLGTALRELRESAGIRIERAARELECSAAKVSRLENGLGPAKTWEVRILLGLYGVDDAATRARFDQWAAQTKSVGWWESDADLTSDDADRYLAYETEAVLLRMFCTPVLPVILQTTSYHHQHQRARVPDHSTDDITRLDGLRTVRQADLVDPDTALTLVAVLDEGALRRQVGGVDVHRRQLAWLADLVDDQFRRDRPSVEIHVLPFSRGLPGRALSAFSLFTPRQPDVDPTVAFVEDAHGGTWYESPDDVEPLVGLFDQLVERSLGLADSGSLIRELGAAPPSADHPRGKA